MKFWKQALLTTTLFTAAVATFLYSSCEKDTCTNVTCYNGGSCGNGKCSCPTGYEGPQCATKSVSRFVGVYAGYSICNNGAQTIDSAFIYADTSSLKFVNYVYVVFNSANVTLHGYVQDNESTYSIIVPQDSITNYKKSYTITLQSNTTLNIASWEYNTLTPADTVIEKCTFVGVDTAAIP